MNILDERKGLVGVSLKGFVEGQKGGRVNLCLDSGQSILDFPDVNSGGGPRLGGFVPSRQVFLEKVDSFHTV